MNTISVTLEALVDRTLAGLQAPNELGHRITLSDDLTTSTTVFNVNDATLFSETQILEFGSEFMFVTDKSDDTAAADVTVVRGYAGTTATAHTTGDVGAISPPWGRKQVADQILAAFPYMEGNRLPLIVTSSELTPEQDPFDDSIWLVDVPATARTVFAVRAGLRDVNGWSYIDNLPTSGTYAYTTGKVVTLPPWCEGYYPLSGPSADMRLTVVYAAAYAWSDDPPDESSTITIGDGCLEVPVKYAIWHLVEARERGRQQVDRSTEWREGVGFDSGPQHVRLARESFFSTLDIARRLEPPPRHRPFVSNPSFSNVY